MVPKVQVVATTSDGTRANRLARAGYHIVFVASGANVTQRRVAA